MTPPKSKNAHVWGVFLYHYSLNNNGEEGGGEDQEGEQEEYDKKGKQ
eukprot:CAMPEP_0201508748 /NCGR_PEP_ID=MMETSP0161_2-20130828/2010_1 /ASSEMBLY_ACC=CAM_ASM_000251 /TAXON_ID=180227 /ORGANISM="Neoparamoeba aestuarina, Strain SoJaBio B1-5/56/2" /LENGTH=46 /DNA_ID= /DNA_START= /DNA_END= /DNA_ORIENTATION=